MIRPPLSPIFDFKLVPLPPADLFVLDCSSSNAFRAVPNETPVVQGNYQFVPLSESTNVIQAPNDMIHKVALLKKSMQENNVSKIRSLINDTEFMNRIRFNTRIFTIACTYNRLNVIDAMLVNGFDLTDKNLKAMSIVTKQNNNVIVRHLLNSENVSEAVKEKIRFERREIHTSRVYRKINFNSRHNPY